LKILVVSGSFFPEISPRAFRATELVRELALLNHSIKVITPHIGFDYDAFCIENSVEILKYKLNWKKELSIGGRSDLLINRMINRLATLLIEYPDLEIMYKLSSVLKHETGYDALISIAVPYPVHWGVARALGKNKSLCNTWIADCGDPYMGSNRIANFFNKHPFYFKYIEKWFCRKADYITIPFEEMAAGFYSEFKNKLVTIPQGFRFDSKPDIQYLKNRVPTFIFAGSIYQKIRDPRPFMEYLCSLSLDFRFILYTKSKELLSDYIGKSKGRIELRDYIPRETLLSEMSKCDFLVNIDLIQEGGSVKLATPSKLIDYLLSGRPILNIQTNKLDFEVINQFLNYDYSNQRFFDISDYNIKTVARKFLDLISKNYASKIKKDRS
jgi:hypothetical protein